jgi:hypothetical protein
MLGFTEAYFYAKSCRDYFKKHGKSQAHVAHITSAARSLGRHVAVTENVCWEGGKFQNIPDLRFINLTTKRVLKLPTSTQLRVTWNTDSLDMVVLTCSNDSCLKVRIIAAVKNIDASVLTRVWQELEYRIDMCRVTRGVHIEHL